jgi:hypothetical protein
MKWTEDRVERLKKLWGEGFSAAQIAKELGEVTRNEVIGKVHRPGLAGRATPSRLKRGPDPKPFDPKYLPQRQPPSSEILAVGKLFISHATKADGARALSLGESIEALKCPCWIASRDIPPGAEWNKTVLRAVQTSAALLVLVSRASAQSKFVKAEVHRAFDLDIPVLQLVIDADVDPASIDMRLLAVQRIDALREGDEKLAQVIVAAIER